MKTIQQFHKANPIMADGHRKLNAIEPVTKISYLTYRSWVRGGPISDGYQIVLRQKGFKVGA